MTRAEAKANYKAASEALEAFLPIEQKSRDDYLAGNIALEEYEAVHLQHNALMKRFNDAFVAVASFPDEDEATEGAF